MKKLPLTVLLLLIAVFPVAAAKNTVASIEDKIREALARDRHGEPLENIVGKELEPTATPTAAPSVKPVTPAPVGPSRLEIWKQRRNDNTAEAAARKS